MVNLAISDYWEKVADADCQSQIFKKKFIL